MLTKIFIKKPMLLGEDAYGEDVIIERGIYDYRHIGCNGWGEVFFNDDWWDFAYEPDDEYFEIV